MATFIAGPCVIESMELLETVAQELVRINEKLGTKIIFKASFDKANRTSIHSFRGPGLEKGLQMLGDIREKYNLRLQQIFMRVIRLQQQAKFVIFSRFQPSSAVRPTFWFLQPRLVKSSTSRRHSS